MIIATVWAAGAIEPRAAVAQPSGADDTVSYTVRKGDTLFGLGQRYFIRADDWRRVQRSNRVANPRKLAIDRQLILPVSFLKYRPATATVAAFRGDATTASGQTGMRPLSVGATLGEGARVATGAASSLSLSLTDGSVITLPSNSRLRIARLRKLLITDSIDYDLALENGAVRSRVTPFRNGADRFRLRNPIAVSAVRGTDFRSRYDAQNGIAFAELIEGGLVISQPQETGQQDTGQQDTGQTLLAPNFGAIIGRPGGITTEPLLAAPVLASGGGAQRRETLAFSVDTVPGAQSYRLQIARDSAFIEVIADALAADTSFTLPALPNGRYFARFTAFAGSGLEGVPGTFAFRRLLNTAGLTAMASNEGYTFRWVGTSDGVQRYQFQLRLQAAQALIIDEANLATSSLIVSDLAPGRYAWRVGTTVFVDGDADTAWTDYESFTVDE